MCGTGSRPVSAMRPANTEMHERAPPRTASTTSWTCRSDMTAVTLSLTPSCDSRRTRLALDSPRVFVTGILTKTFSPHAAIARACRSISSNSSENTSNEIGRSGMAASTSVAKA